MNATPRSLMARCVICGVGAIGLALGALEPLKSAHADALMRFEQSQRLASRASGYALLAPVQAAENDDVERSLADIAERSAPARDAAKLNAAIEALALKAGVAVRRTQPREDSDGAAPARPAEGADAAPAVRPDATLAFTIDVTGPYAGLTRFVRALETDLGYTAVSSVRLTPESENRDLVRASITTRHYAFSLPEPAPDAVPEGGVTSAEGSQ